VFSVHVGCTIFPATGGSGIEGWGLITTAADEAEVHPYVFVTLKV
jgi:hypothetical protein